MIYFLDNWHKIVFVLAMIVMYPVAWSLWINQNQQDKTERSMEQMSSYKATQEMRQNQIEDNNVYVFGWIGIVIAAILIFVGDIRKFLKLSMATAILFSIGCSKKPFEPVKLEVIQPNEEAFLLPYTGDAKKQQASDNAAYLKANMVYTKQIQIPQQWVPKGYESMGWNGEWRDAATLVKVDKSPVTREWTADPNSGTSTRNEAVWVMTSDQVEFSTGWTCTARISGQDDAVKFLHNYPNGSLVKVMDSEIRAKLQAEFGLEVTDLPMDELRKNATPHVTKTTKSISDFFLARGISITNLGITGGFVYKDKKISDMMVKMFNAEQEKSIAAAESAAQAERNHKVVLEATGKADATLKENKAKADGIKMIADARQYEIDMAMKSPDVYMRMKQLELQKELLMRWDGSYPRYFMGGGANGSPNMLLQLPPLEPEKKR